MSLSAEQARRYARHILLPDVGGVGQKRLLAAEVTVPVDKDRAAAAVAVAYLCAAGVGTVRLRGDGGTVDTALVSRSMWLTADDLGTPLAAALARAAAALNPDTNVVSGGDDPIALPGPASPDLATALERGGTAAAIAIGAIAR